MQIYFLGNFPYGITPDRVIPYIALFGVIFIVQWWERNSLNVWNKNAKSHRIKNAGLEQKIWLKYKTGCIRNHI